MTIKEAMNIIHGAIDGLCEFYGNEVDKELEEIFEAEAVLDNVVENLDELAELEYHKVPENYWAECPHCGHELEYEHFQYESCDEDKVFFFANGTCVKCGKNFDWCETFELVDIEFDEEIDEE
jgi:hypothetical protein